MRAECEDVRKIIHLCPSRNALRAALALKVSSPESGFSRAPVLFHAKSCQRISVSMSRATSIGPSHLRRPSMRSPRCNRIRTGSVPWHNMHRLGLRCHAVIASWLPAFAAHTRQDWPHGPPTATKLTRWRQPRPRTCRSAPIESGRAPRVALRAALPPAWGRRLPPCLPIKVSWDQIPTSFHERCKVAVWAVLAKGGGPEPISATQTLHDAVINKCASCR